MFRKILLCLAASILLAAACMAQVSYDDVAVIINTNSAASQTIGNYFRVKHNIPSGNLLYVSADTTEEIDSAAFHQLRAQIETQLIQRNIQNSINYLVTTKGVPLKVNRGSVFSQTSPSSSVESELMLILGGYSSYIGGAGPQMSPYFYQNAHFSRTAYGVYLVTRLDGYTVQEVLNLIDRSGPNQSVDSQSPVLLDQDPSWSSPLNTYMSRARTTLEGKGVAVLLDSTTVFQTNKPGLLGYMSWGSNDHYQYLYTQNAIPHNTYVPGAIAETYVSTSGRSFADPPSYGQSLIADLIGEGVSGAKGYVYEPYSNAMAYAYLLFDRYTSGYNLAESYFMASLLVSWMDVVVGDPKTSVNLVQGPLPVQLAEFKGTIVSAGNSIDFTWRTLSETNNYGFYLQRSEDQTGMFADVPNSFVGGHGTTLIPQNYSWMFVAAPAGTACFRLRQVDMDGFSHYSDPIAINHSVSGVDTQPLAAEFALQQNYPNPFNPTTTISFSIPGEADAELRIYDVSGRDVATLLKGRLQAGTYRQTFDGSGLSSGVYYYRLAAGSRVETRRMLLVK